MTLSTTRGHVPRIGNHFEILASHGYTEQHLKIPGGEYRQIVNNPLRADYRGVLVIRKLRVFTFSSRGHQVFVAQYERVDCPPPRNRFQHITWSLDRHGVIHYAIVVDESPNDFVPVEQHSYVWNHGELLLHPFSWLELQSNFPSKAS